MTKNNQPLVNQPQPETVKAPAKGPAMVKATAISGNAFDLHNAKINAEVLAKAQAMNTSRQHFAEACDYYRDGDKSAAVAVQAAAKGALAIYSAAKLGNVNRQEISALLGDVFGYVTKKDGSPGKTPAGQGGSIRKRVFRALDGAEYLTGNVDERNFCDGLPVDEVTSLLSAMEQEQASIFTVYDELGKVKREQAVKLSACFDPSKIEAITVGLTADIDVTLDVIGNSESLLAEYAKLRGVIELIGDAIVAAQANMIETANPA